MLEFKDVSLSHNGRQILTDVSFIVRDGEALSVRADSSLDKTYFLQALLGMIPIDKGYINVEGEMLTVDSAETFRTMMCYIPKDFTLPYQKVSELITELTTLKSNKQQTEYSKDNLLALWAEFGIPESIYDNNCSETDETLLRQIALSVMTFLDKRIVLIDGDLSEIEKRMLASMATHGTIAVVTGYGMESAKQITLNTNL